MCDSGRVEGLILNKDEEGDTDQEREPQERPCNRGKIPGQWEGEGAHAQQGLGGGQDTDQERKPKERPYNRGKIPCHENFYIQFNAG